MDKKMPPSTLPRRILNYLVVIFIVMIFAGVLLGPTTPPSPLYSGLRTASMQHARIIGLCLSRYADDHQGHYPDGTTSTAVFQKLIDEKYVDDPSIFYEGTPAKVRPGSNHLMAENVGWDVTCCVDLSAPIGLPLVYLTGYKITYQAGAPAMPIIRSRRTWTQWWNGPDRYSFMKTFITVCYKDGSARAIKTDDDGSIPNFIPADFDPKGKTYRQLTP